MRSSLAQSAQSPAGALPKAPLSARLWKQRYLILMSMPFVVWVVAMNYLPIFGWVMAFQDFKLKKGMIASFTNAPFVGLKHFRLLWQDFLNQGRFYFALRNTIAMSLLALTFGFVMPIIFALMLNEIRMLRFKKAVQTISYLPHFISWVVAAGMISTMLSAEGPVNDLMLMLGLSGKRLSFLADEKLFWGIITVADIWKELGWNAIIFLAAITGVDPGLYESASIDGASRLKKIWHITLPCIMPVIIVILIMNIGWLLSMGFEKQYLLGSDITRNYSEVLDVYVIKYGIGQSRYSFGTAIGLFKSVVSIVLVFMANFIAKLAGQTSIV
jgi:putative aldouronate transport system permease protein